jgi:hypothetical protein
MRTKTFSVALVLLFAGPVGCSSSGSSEPGTLTPTVDPQPGVVVSQAEMPDACKSAAAKKYNQNPSNIQTMPAKQNRGTFTVDGQYPPKTRDGKKFSCLFSSDGKLMSVDDN